MKKRQRLFLIGNFQLLQFINVIIFPLYHIFSITVIFRDGIVELVKMKWEEEILELENYLNFLIHYYYPYYY